MQEVSGVYTSPFLHTDERKMALRARKLSGAFEKRAPRPLPPGKGQILPDGDLLYSEMPSQGTPICIHSADLPFN